MVMNSFGQHIRAIWHFPPPRPETRLLPGRSGVWDWASATPEILISPNLLSSSVIQLNLACRTCHPPQDRGACPSSHPPRHLEDRCTAVQGPGRCGPEACGGVGSTQALWPLTLSSVGHTEPQGMFSQTRHQRQVLAAQSICPVVSWQRGGLISIETMQITRFLLKVKSQ